MKKLIYYNSMGTGWMYAILILVIATAVACFCLRSQFNDEEIEELRAEEKNKKRMRSYTFAVFSVYELLILAKPTLVFISDMSEVYANVMTKNEIASVVISFIWSRIGMSLVGAGFSLAFVTLALNCLRYYKYYKVVSERKKTPDYECAPPVATYHFSADRESVADEDDTPVRSNEYYKDIFGAETNGADVPKNIDSSDNDDSPSEPSEPSNNNSNAVSGESVFELSSFELSLNSFDDYTSN